MRSMGMRKGSIILWMTALVAAALPANAMASSYRLGYNTDANDNDYISTTRAPRGRIGKSMFISFRVRATGEDMNSLRISLQRTNDFQQVEERDNGDYTVGYYPSEVMGTTFLAKSVGDVKKGNIKSVSLSANVRRNAQQGYYNIPTYLEWDGGSDTDYISVRISTDIPSGADNEEDIKKGNYFMIGGSQSTPRGIYSNVVDCMVNFRNKRDTTAQDVTVSMQLSEDDTKFPFEINNGNCDGTFEWVQSGETVSTSYSMAIRKDSYSEYYPTRYTITFRLSSEEDLHKEEGTFYVHIISEDKEDDLRDFDANDKTRARLTVDSYYAVPEQVFAGDEFELTLSVKNAPTSVPASNVLFSLESEKVSDNAVFTTESGSSSMVVNDLGAGQSAEVRTKFAARAGVDQRPYTIIIKGKYDSPEFKSVEESIVVDIPVKQYVRLSTGTIDVMPDSMTVGSEFNIMFRINNTGEVIFYSMMATFESDSVKTTDAYVGNIEPSEAGSVNVILTGINPVTDDGTVKIFISYEDKSDVAADPVVEKLTLLIVEEVDESFGMNMNMETGAMNAQVNPSFWSEYKVLIIAGAVAATGAGVTAVVVIKKKRRAAKEEDVDDETS